MEHMEDHLVRIINSSSDWTEARSRIAAAYGEPMGIAAKRVAIEQKGKAWVSNSKDEASNRDGESFAEEQNQRLRIEFPSVTLNVPKIELSVLPPSNPRELGAARFSLDSVLLATAGILALALVFPPFYLPLTEGLVTNMGFGFILNPPVRGTLVALVNLPLLCLECVFIMFVAVIFGSLGRFK